MYKRFLHTFFVTATMLFMIAGIGAVSVSVLVLRPTAANALDNGLARTPPMGFNNTHHEQHDLGVSSRTWHRRLPHAYAPDLDRITL